MARQIRGVVKILNQPPVATSAAPNAVPDDERLVALGETVERMGRELRGVLNLLIQQQATLVRLTQGAPVGPAVASGTGARPAESSAADATGRFGERPQAGRAPGAQEANASLSRYQRKGPGIEDAP